MILRFRLSYCEFLHATRNNQELIFQTQEIGDTEVLNWKIIGYHFIHIKQYNCKFYTNTSKINQFRKELGWDLRCGSGYCHICELRKWQMKIYDNEFTECALDFIHCTFKIHRLLKQKPYHETLRQIRPNENNIYWMRANQISFDYIEFRMPRLLHTFFKGDMIS